MTYHLRLLKLFRSHPSCNGLSRQVQPSHNNLTMGRCTICLPLLRNLDLLPLQLQAYRDPLLGVLRKTIQHPRRRLELGRRRLDPRRVLGRRRFGDQLQLRA